MIGAPECYRAEDEFLERATLQIKQSVDIWSLGGVFSEAAVWVANGYYGIREYRQSRKKETSQVGGFKDGDCFHDGTKVLQAVRKQHQDIIGILRKSDVITALVLSLIEDDMLVTPDEARLTATQLWHKSRTILVKAERQVGSPGASTTDLPLEPPERPTSSHPPPHPEGTHPISRNPTLRQGSTDSTPSDRGALRDIYPRTSKCLAEQHKTIDKCKTTINLVKNVSKIFRTLRVETAFTNIAKSYYISSPQPRIVCKISILGLHVMISRKRATSSTTSGPRSNPKTPIRCWKILSLNSI